MHVTVKLFAGLRDLAGASDLDEQFEGDSITITEFAHAFAERRPALRSRLETDTRLFGVPPTNETVAALEDQYDFTALDTLMPHPEYAPQWWVCVLSPSDTTFEQVKPLLAEAYAIAARRNA